MKDSVLLLSVDDCLHLERQLEKLSSRLRESLKLPTIITDAGQVGTNFPVGPLLLSITRDPDLGPPRLKC